VVESFKHSSEEDNDQDNPHATKQRRQCGVGRVVYKRKFIHDNEASDSEPPLSTPVINAKGLRTAEVGEGGEFEAKLEQSHVDAQEEDLTNESQEARVTHLGKRKRNGIKAAEPQENTNTPENLTPPLAPDNGQINTPQGSPSPEKNGAGGILKRLPGRRRAPHADPQVEAKLRRQLELKVAYRAVAKAQKLVLAELARRTAEELEANIEAHKNYEEYEEITEQLELRLNQRLQILQSFFDEEEARLKRIMLAQEHIIKEGYRVSNETAVRQKKG